MKPLVKDIGNIRLGIIGMTEGNGHPYSWSAIFNRYDKAKMEQLCPFAGIPVYLNKENHAQMGIPGAHVTHVYCDNRADAEKVSACSLIPHIVDTPEEMIGQVDAVIIATDIGSEHVRRAKPFIDANLPIFIDKPLCDNENDLAYFSEKVASGAKILSSSAMRYAKEYRIYHHPHTHEFGELRHIFVPMAKKWETYGIHALESLYPILGPGFTSVRNTGDAEHNIVHIKHKNNCHVTIACIKDMLYGGSMQLGGTQGNVTVKSMDTYQSFRDQLVAFVDYLKSGISPIPFAETAEMMKIIIAGIQSREQNGKEIEIK